MKKLLAISFVSILATIACTKDTPTPSLPLPDVTITATSTVCIDTPGRFMATIGEAAKDEITIKVTNANPELMEVNAETIIIEKGKTEGKVDFTGKAIGIAKVSFSSLNATVKTAELGVTMILPLID